MLSIGSTRQNRPLIASSGGSCRGNQFGTGRPSGGSSGVLFILEQSRFHGYKRRYSNGPWIGQAGAEPKLATNGISCSQAGRIAHGCSASRHVANDHTACADQRILADTHARQDYRTAPDPHITPDADRATKLQPGGPVNRIARMIGGEDLNPWPYLRLFTNDDLYDIEDHAVEIQEHTRTETDVEAVVAVKGWPDHRTFADRSEALQQDSPQLGGRCAKGRVVSREPFMGYRHLRLEFGRVRVVQFPR